mmetsp:Transcript_19357/g.48422  ORF Transcript_19357/g.48422 Transcript_19357/m.48422 type:complete len:158 (+) Transcript_19357:1663-2136(+)
MACFQAGYASPPTASSECTDEVIDSPCTTAAECQAACDGNGACAWRYETVTHGFPMDYQDTKYPLVDSNCRDYLQQQEHAARGGYVNPEAWCGPAALGASLPAAGTGVMCAGQGDSLNDILAHCVYRMIADAKKVSEKSCVDAASCKAVCEDGNHWY